MFFFKQKTAYEMRISDWSSDVCSSDLKRYKFVFFKFPALCQSRGYALIFGSHTAPGAVIDVQGAGNGDLGSPLAAGFQHLRHVLLWDHVFGLAGASPRRHRSRSAVFGTVFIIMACAQRLVSFGFPLPRPPDQ